MSPDIALRAKSLSSKSVPEPFFCAGASAFPVFLMSSAMSVKVM